jgi:acylphosphatase
MFHYTVRGMVQGVFFRYYTKEMADKLAIKGTVKNLANGDVEVFAQGDPAVMNQFETFLNHGSPSSSVKQVVKEEIETFSAFPDFEIIG